MLPLASKVNTEEYNDDEDIVGAGPSSLAGWRGHDLHGHVTLGRHVEKPTPVDVPVRLPDAGTLRGTAAAPTKTSTEDPVRPGNAV